MYLNIKHIFAYSLVSLFCLSCNKQTEKQSSPTADSNRIHEAPAAQSKDTVAVSSTNDSVPTDQKALLIGNVLREQLLKNDLNILTENDRKFRYTEADLNGDGDKEIFVGMAGSYFCGTGGCTVYLLNSKGKKINGFTVVGGPIAISSNKTNGWADLIIPSKSKNYLIKYTGKIYPGNPSIQPEYKEALPPSFQIVLGEHEAEYSF
ncbi:MULTISPECIES: hypothetical protein [Chryseobacterium]|uniref:hypothetical protein n=1 Tax=Chryseobacterium TaxID=59732 RepID=UPI0012951973|nr:MULTISPECIES: hypothetical protein [Chryseobacterium]MDR6920074.1 hypothetical protein [Chryseobacterium sp. 2987]